MPSKKKQDAPSWQVILEEIRSDNRSTIEAVEALRVSLEQRIERLDEDSRARDRVLELGMRQNSLDIRGLKADVQQNSLDIRGLKADVQQNSLDIRELKAGVQQNSLEIGELKATLHQHSLGIRALQAGVNENSVDLRALTAKAEGLARIEERVAALERRPS